MPSELAPLSQPWKLIRDAVADLEKMENVDGVVIDMMEYHRILNGTCHMCLAGCVMAQIQSIQRNETYSPFDFNQKTSNKLEFISSVALNGEHWKRLDLTNKQREEIKKRSAYFVYYRYEISRERFKQRVLKIADIYEQVLTATDDDASR